MKDLLLYLIFFGIFTGRVQSQSLSRKCIGIDTSIKKVQAVKFNGTLVGMEMLPQGIPFIKKLERTKSVLRNHHYYSVQIKPDSCDTTEWFICGDNHFILPKNFKDSIKVRLLGTFYGNVNDGIGLPVIINQVFIH